MDENACFQFPGKATPVSELSHDFQSTLSVCIESPHAEACVRPLTLDRRLFSKPTMKEAVVSRGSDDLCDFSSFATSSRSAFTLANRSQSAPSMFDVESKTLPLPTVSPKRFHSLYELPVAPSKRPCSHPPNPLKLQDFLVGQPVLYLSQPFL
jgi:hypothetical protein